LPLPGGSRFSTGLMTMLSRSIPVTQRNDIESDPDSRFRRSTGGNGQLDPKPDCPLTRSAVPRPGSRLSGPDPASSDGNNQMRSPIVNPDHGGTARLLTEDSDEYFAAVGGFLTGFLPLHAAAHPGPAHRGPAGSPGGVPRPAPPEPTADFHALGYVPARSDEVLVIMVVAREKQLPGGTGQRRAEAR
jgi:hypothetical protein